MALSGSEISVFLFLVNIMLVGIMAYSWLINKKLPGTGAWTVGIMFFGLGIMFYILSAYYNRVLIDAAGMLLRMAGAFTVIYGCGIFIGRDSHKKASLTLFILFSLISVFLLINRKLQPYLFIIDIFFLSVYSRGVFQLISARIEKLKGGFAVIYPLSSFLLFHFYNILTVIPIFGGIFPELTLGEIASTYTVFLGGLVMTQVLQGYFRFREEIISAAREKEVLLSEMHHRTKNNLFLINNMVNLDSMHVNDPEAREILEVLRNKIKTVMLLHQQLQDIDNTDSINAEEYLGLVIDSFEESRVSGKNLIGIIKDIEPLELEVSSAIPIGLILNELVTNCRKHAFADGEAGSIYITLKLRGDTVEVTVSDNGKGLSGPPEKDSLGLSLVKTLTKQLKGEFVIENNRTERGTRAVLTFPFRIY